MQGNYLQINFTPEDTHKLLLFVFYRQILMVNLSRGKIHKQWGPHTQAIGFKQGSGKKISILMLQGEAN
jgi:hypothetical protein